MIQFHNVHKRYPNGFESLRDVSLHMARGQMLFVTGHSGAGKSTLLKLIARMEAPTGGRIVINGKNLSTVSRGGLPYYRRRVGFVFQDHKLLFDRSVFDNVALPLRIFGAKDEEVKKRTRAALDKVGLLSKLSLMPEVLSAGEQQRVGIARAVVHRPAILLADEPTGNLDPDLSFEILKSFEQFNQVGVTVLIATHDINLINAMPHRIIELKNGRLVADDGV